MPEQKEVELYLTCPKSLEGLLLDEAQSLGLTDAREQLSGVSGAWHTRGCLSPVSVVTFG